MSGLSVTITDEADRVLGTLARPLVVQQGGSGATTPSAVTNTPSPGIAIEASSAPLPAPAGTPLSTLPAAATRAGYWFFENQSPSVLTVVLDDGQGNALSVFTMAAAPADGGQGGTMGAVDTGPHLGRIRVYGPANSHHSLRAQ